jgi:rhodanese-related sulfurtransferase
MSISGLKYIEAAELVTHLQEPGDSKVVVIDVRNEDEFASGHIKGACNVPSTKWGDESFVKDFIQQYTGEGAASTNLVFHCAYSAKRGPTVAQIIQDAIKDVVASGTDASTLPSV